MKKIAIAVVMGLGLATSGLAQADVLTNGDFFNGLTGWTVSGSDAPADASVAGFYGIGAIGQEATLTQALKTVSGQNYDLKFDFYDSTNPGQSSTFAFAVAGSDVKFNFDPNTDTFSAPNNFKGGALSYSTVTGNYSVDYQFKATSTPTSLVFTTQNNSGFNYVGNVSVSAVPEPEEWAMMMLGLPLMGWIARRKKTAIDA